MDIKNLFNLNSVSKSAGFFAAYGNFGFADGGQDDIDRIIKTNDGYSADYDDFSVNCNLKELDNDVILRSDTFTAKKDLTLNRFVSRFALEGGEYEVYTQNSSWQNESIGGWQPLITAVEISSSGMRSTEGGTPFAAIKNKGNGKILVFHLLPNAMWKIKISKAHLNGEKFIVVFEAGINDCGLNMKLSAGDKVEMPQIICYEATNTLDLDAWRLHSTYNKLYPRKSLPVIYNTWLLHFDTIDIENIFKQVECASELGVEYFVVDAGWFGNGKDWCQEIGVWSENKQGGFMGRLKELSDKVRASGMKFGLWIEPERTLTRTDSYKAHPDYYIVGEYENAFIDFSKTEARKYITDVVLGLIEKYNIEFLKFDFNATLYYDISGNAFYNYFSGTRAFLADIRKRYPDIYITNCASGGSRMDLANGILYDSVWSSDNQSPIDGFRIFKDTALRMPPCHIEKWDVRRFFEGFPQYGKSDLGALPISCHGATWESVRNVTSAYTHSFLTGGPIGFSTDIAAYPESEKKALKEHIEKFKNDRNFYKNATLRILYDTAEITVLEYANSDFSHIMIQIFTDTPHQDTVTVYPVLDQNKNYSCEEKILTGKEIYKCGICKNITSINCITLELKSE